MDTISRKVTRTHSGRFCTLEIELKDGELSIRGTEGRIVKRKTAKEEAIQYWESYFDENPGEIITMGKKFGKQFRTSRGAAKFVLEVDGEFDGLNVIGPENGSTVRIVECCGQIQDLLLLYFPEVKPLLPWHLNKMHAGCEHQDELGWGDGKTIALTKDTLTEAQRKTLDGKAEAVVKLAREKEFARRWNETRSSEAKAVAWLKSHGEGFVSVDGVAGFCADTVYGANLRRRDYVRWMEEDVRKDIPLVPFEAEIYKDSLRAPCPTCGYEYGTEWLKRELPAEIVELAKTVCEPVVGIHHIDDSDRRPIGSRTRQVRS
jgi:hypothetical protein